MARVLAKDLRESVLQAAFQGKLTTKDVSDGNVWTALSDLNETKQKLIKQKKIKKEPSLSALNDDEIPYDIPDHWAWVKLGEIIDCGSGSTPLKGHSEYYSNGTIPWLKTGELNNSFITYCEEKITEEAFNKGSFRVNKPGDILIAMYGATIGKLGICTFETTTNQACLGCTPYSLLNNMYLFHYLKSAKDALVGKAEGGAQPNISRIKVRNHPIPLPPIEEQTRIVAKVDEIMAKIDEYEKLENKLVKLKEQFPQDMKDSLLHSAFEGSFTNNSYIDNENSDWAFDKIVDGWNYQSYEDVCTITTGLSFPKTEQCLKSDSDLRILRGGNIYDDYRYRLKDDDIYVKYREKYTKLLSGDVITPSVTSLEKHCKVGFIENDLKNITAGGFVYIFRTKDMNMLLPRYLMYYITSPQNKAMCMPNIHKSGQAFYNLKKNGLIKQIIPIPPIEEQQRIVNKLDELLPLVDKLAELN